MRRVLALLVLLSCAAGCGGWSDVLLGEPPGYKYPPVLHEPGSIRSLSAVAGAK